MQFLSNTQTFNESLGEQLSALTRWGDASHGQRVVNYPRPLPFFYAGIPLQLSEMAPPFT